MCKCESEHTVCVTVWEYDVQMCVGVCVHVCIRTALMRACDLQTGTSVSSPTTACTAVSTSPAPTGVSATRVTGWPATTTAAWVSQRLHRWSPTSLALRPTPPPPVTPFSASTSTRIVLYPITICGGISKSRYT